MLKARKNSESFFLKNAVIFQVLYRNCAKWKMSGISTCTMPLLQYFCNILSRCVRRMFTRSREIAILGDIAICLLSVIS